MLQSIKKFFKGSEVKEVLTEVKANPFKNEQETLNSWFKVLNLHFGKSEFYFLVDYSKEEMVLVSDKELEIHAINFNTQFVFKLEEGVQVTNNNARRCKKLLTALYKYYNKEEVQIEGAGNLSFA